MSDTSVKIQINNLIASHLGIDPEKVDFEKSIFEHYNADPLDEIEIMMALEELFVIELPDDNYETPNDFLKAVKANLKV